MRILLWAPFGAGTHYWGPGTSTFRLYKSAKKNNSLTTLVHGSMNQGLFKEVFENQVFISNLEKGIIPQFRYLIYSYFWIYKNKKKHDVFHGLGAFEMTFGPALKWANSGKPAFIKMTGHHGGFGNNSKLSKFLGIASNRVKNANKITGYIANSKDIQQNLLKHGIAPEKIHMIPNGVDTNVFYPISSTEKNTLRKKLQINDKPTYIIVGGLSDRKQQYKSVLAISNLVKNGNDIQLLLVGPDRSGGIELEKINSFLNSNPTLKKNILHIPFTETPELYYQISDYYLLASKSEGMPNTLLEAMATRLPCIVTPVSGSIDLIGDNENGLITGFSEEEIYNSCEYLLKNPNFSRIKSNNAFELIQSTYKSEVVFNQYMELFKKNIF